MNQKHFVIFSHGFGVRKDSLGLFTEIAKSLINCEPIFTDLNDYNENENTLTIRPLPEQVSILKQTIEKVIDSNPGAVVDLVCHSQGCIIAGLSKPLGIRKIILLAPPIDISIKKTMELFGDRYSSKIKFDDVSRFHRRDGSTTLVPKEYWHEREDVNPPELYKQLATISDVTIIKAVGDEMLADNDLSSIEHLNIVSIESDHNFNNSAREKLLGVVLDCIDLK